jgi:rare lipoprotein A
MTEPRLGLGGGNGIYAANGETSGPEYFSTAMVGVDASPRVAKGPRLPRGGGTEKIGSPYTVRGRTYYPTENPKKVEVGLASWYGAAFHGRLTANGEVYDMNHLTAAHKTMPLPSYARVTNTENGRSLIVRVNDRGPFAHDRVIDLSKRAADLLDYTHGGTARVKVEYAGRAPLDGHDDAFLMASVRGVPGYPAGDRFGQPASGVLVAMNGSTPTAGPVPPRALGDITGTVPADRNPLLASAQDGGAQVVLPANVPFPGERPAVKIEGVAISAYASMRVAKAFAGMSLGENATGWKSR